MFVNINKLIKKGRYTGMHMGWQVFGGWSHQGYGSQYFIIILYVKSNISLHLKIDCMTKIGTVDLIFIG